MSNVRQVQWCGTVLDEVRQDIKDEIPLRLTAQDVAFGEATIIPWEALQPGDVFRLIEPDGLIANKGREHEYSVALSAPERLKTGTWIPTLCVAQRDRGLA